MATIRENNNGKSLKFNFCTYNNPIWNSYFSSFPICFYLFLIEEWRHNISLWISYYAIAEFQILLIAVFIFDMEKENWKQKAVHWNELFGFHRPILAFWRDDAVKCVSYFHEDLADHNCLQFRICHLRKVVSLWEVILPKYWYHFYSVYCQSSINTPKWILKFVFVQPSVYFARLDELRWKSPKTWIIMISSWHSVE